MQPTAPNIFGTDSSAILDNLFSVDWRIKPWMMISDAVLQTAVKALQTHPRTGHARRQQESETWEGDPANWYIEEGADIDADVQLTGYIIALKGCRIGRGAQVKNTVLLPGAKLAHVNIVRNSVIGQDVNLSALTLTTNLRQDSHTIRLDWDGGLQDTGERKMGAIIGDGCFIGGGCILCPGTVLGKKCSVYPGNTIAHTWPPESTIGNPPLTPRG